MISIDGIKLLASLANGTKKSSSKTECIDVTNDIKHVELRNLEAWHDEDEKSIDERCLQELNDPSNPCGWSADEMFEYNEKMHKITSTYSEKTLADKYSIPVPKNHSKSTNWQATQLADEIERKNMEQGRVTPESSDDDELFEDERKLRLLQHQAHNRLQKLQQQQKQLNQLKNTQRQQPNRLSNGYANTLNCVNMSKSIPQLSKFAKSSPKSSVESPAFKHTSIKPVSSSRNILRSCLA